MAKTAKPHETLTGESRCRVPAIRQAGFTLNVGFKPSPRLATRPAGQVTAYTYKDAKSLKSALERKGRTVEIVSRVDPSCRLGPPPRHRAAPPPPMLYDPSEAAGTPPWEQFD